MSRWQVDGVPCATIVDLLADDCLEQFTQTHDMDPFPTIQALQQLHDGCEDIIALLSSRRQATLKIASFSGGVTLDVTVTRAKLQELLLRHERSPTDESALDVSVDWSADPGQYGEELPLPHTTPPQAAEWDFVVPPVLSARSSVSPPTNLDFDYVRAPTGGASTSANVEGASPSTHYLRLVC